MKLTAEAISEYLSRIASRIEAVSILIRFVVSSIVFSDSLSLCSLYESVYAFFLRHTRGFVALFYIFSCAADTEGDFLLPETPTHCKNSKEGGEASGRPEKTTCALNCL